MRKLTREIKIGNRVIGGNNSVLIQSMTKTKTDNVEDTVAQILELTRAGCDIIRSAIPDMKSARAIYEIKKAINIPFVADIHFDYKLAIAAIENGADKIRINPGNIGDRDRVKKVIDAAKAHRIPIRIGINSGSLEKEILAKYGAPTALALVESAINNVRLVEGMGFEDIVVSIKSSDVMLSIDSYKLFAQQCDYPLHIGVTEAGTIRTGTIKSAVGIGTLLYEGIGDTLRVSLTGDPIEEIIAGKQILKCLGMYDKGIEIISCPTCGRTNVDMRDIVDEMEKGLNALNIDDIKVAIMGCAVNGPGEAREADIGIAGGMGEYILFKKGEIIKKMPQADIVNNFIKEVLDFSRQKK